MYPISHKLTVFLKGILYHLPVYPFISCTCKPIRAIKTRYHLQQPLITSREVTIRPPCRICCSLTLLYGKIDVPVSAHRVQMGGTRMSHLYRRGSGTNKISGHNKGTSQRPASICLVCT